MNILIQKKLALTRNVSSDSSSTTILALFVPFLDFTVVHSSFSLTALHALSASNSTSASAFSLGFFFLGGVFQ
jgi:hypothetical protein